MSGSRADDRRARLAAQQVFDRPLLLEAGAGTGKTTTLVTRVLSWCLGVGWQTAATRLADDGDHHEVAAETLEGVVAITFTEAAAAEMAARLAAALAEVTDGNEGAVVGFDPGLLDAEVEPAERRQRAASLLEAYDHLTVGTIHAFCFGLLKTHSLEAALHPDLVVDAEGRDLEAIGRLAVEQAVQRAYDTGEDTPFIALAARGIGPGRLLEAALEWLAEGPGSEVLAEDPLGPETLRAFAGALGTTIDDLLEILGHRLDGLPAGRLAVRVREALEATGRLLTRDAVPPGSEEYGELWPDNLLGRLSDWGRGRLRTNEEKEHLGGVEDLARRAAAVVDGLRTLSALDPALLQAARLALRPILEQIETEMRRRGAITFSGLLREALRLLEHSPSVLARERQRIRLLLVDEFQDTDSVQSRIVRLLGLEGDVETRPSLFVVGDPKQSIYGWRDADLAAYEAFQEALLDAGGECHVLSRNFRSVPAILDEVERVVEPIMRYERGVQPEFRGLESTRRNAAPDDAWHPLEYWVSWRAQPGGGTLAPASHDEAQEIEAQAVAADIRRLHEQRGIPWNRFAILFRKSGSQPPFLDALRRLDVPFAVTRDRNYYQRREIIDAAAWVRSIVNPNDHLALVTVLRSPTVGVPDAALIPLWRQEFPRLVTELGGPSDSGLGPIQRAIERLDGELPTSLPGIERLDGWQDSLLAAIGALRRLRAAYRSEPADRFVRRLRSELLIEASEAARFQGKFRLANLGRFFRRLESALESDEADVHAVLRVLRLGVMEGREAEEATPRDAAEVAVQVMTIHTAKGLEFDHVYLVQLHSGTRMGGNELLEVGKIRSGAWAYRLFGAPTPGFVELEAHRNATEAAESVRTLYVAMTRAAERLVMVGNWPETLRPKDPESARNYVDLVQNRGNHPDSLAELANDPSVALRGYREHDGIRWRFPGGEHTFGGGRRARQSPTWLPDSAGFRRMVDEHEGRHALATTRMKRPWTRAATGEVSVALEELASAFQVADEERPELAPGARQVARDIGTEIHRCLERWDLTADLDQETLVQREALRERLADLSEEDLERALERFERLAGGSLLARLRSLAPHILGREVPLLLQPRADEDPLGCFSGSIDLLYRDPSTDSVVVADFKTDRVESEREIAERAAIYRQQEERYARAVEEALGLTSTPRTELWFLWPDRLWTDSDARRNS